MFALERLGMSRAELKNAFSVLQLLMTSLRTAPTFVRTLLLVMETLLKVLVSNA
jgi:hypothetical protein